MPTTETTLVTRLARSEADLLGAQRLRYEVFVEELGGDGPLVDHSRRFERDRWDAHYDHLVLVDSTRDEARLDHIVGAYRLMPGDRADAAGGFYTAGEYDLAPLLRSEKRLLELGRSCLRADYRGGTGLWQLWSALAEYVEARQLDVLFGVASFHGTDTEALAQPLAFLHHNHLAPEAYRVRAKAGSYTPMDVVAANQIDRLKAARAIPSLIKGYLRLGGWVGDGAFVDKPFNTTDICLVMDTSRIAERQRAIYTGGRR